MARSSPSAQRSKTAVLVLDLITDLDFSEGDRLCGPALAAASRIAPLLARARRARVAVLYANDDRGRWRSDAPGLLLWCKRAGSRGREIARVIEPTSSDQVLLKPKHSAFFGTPLDILLDRMGTQRLIVTGVSAHQCVLFTATDAHVREFELVIPRDCVASPRSTQTRFALQYFKDVLGADTRLSTRVRLAST